MSLADVGCTTINKRVVVCVFYAAATTMMNAVKAKESWTREERQTAALEEFKGGWTPPLVAAAML